MHGQAYTSDINSFCENFLPPNRSTSVKSVPNIFDGTPTTFPSEKAMYKYLCDRLNKSGHFEGMVFVATGYEPDPSGETQQDINCGMYVSTSAPGRGRKPSRTDSVHAIWSFQELGIECTLAASLDPFDGYQGGVQLDSVPQGRKFALAQLLSNASLVFKFQKRLFHYIVIFFGRYARIIRFDHSGIVATEKIDYTTDSARLTEFFVRYSRFKETNRGHDPTATRIDPTGKDAKTAELAAAIREYGRKAAEERPKDHVPPLFNKTLDEQWPWWKLKVYD